MIFYELVKKEMVEFMESPFPPSLGPNTSNKYGPLIGKLYPIFIEFGSKTFKDAYKIEENRLQINEHILKFITPEEAKAVSFTLNGIICEVSVNDVVFNECIELDPSSLFKASHMINTQFINYCLENNLDIQLVID